MIAITIPQSEIGKIILEVIALSIIAGLARLFLIEKTIVGGWKQFFGGIFFGSLIGYLFYIVPSRYVYYEYTGKVWRLWSVMCAIFGKEILFVFKSGIIDLLPVIKTFCTNQARRVAKAWNAYKN